MKTVIQLSEKLNIAIANAKMHSNRNGVAAQYDVIISGVKAFRVDDDASGAMYNYRIFDNELFNKFKCAVESLPVVMVDGAAINIDCDLALAIIHDVQITKQSRKRNS